VLLVVVNFAYFFPLYTDQLMTHDEWLNRMWFRSWI
jgi:dolichyl-phosphate-mannose--protein O-mannosyl transferase